MIVLASGSPRRASLLKEAGIAFIVRVPKADETAPAGVPPREAVLSIARRKADAVAAERGMRAGEFLLAADTEVVLDGATVGKPRDPMDARRILSALSGRTHVVMTAVVVRSPLRREHADVVETEVEFAPLSPAQIAAYVATGEPLDKAGAYGIQGAGAALVKAVRGDRTNVIGLPMERTKALLAQAGFRG